MLIKKIKYRKYIFIFILMLLGIMYNIYTMHKWYSVSIIGNDPASRLVVAKEIYKVIDNYLPPIIYYFWFLLSLFISINRNNVFFIQIMLYLVFVFSAYFLYKKLIGDNFATLIITFITISSSSILRIFVQPNYYSLQIIIYSWIFIVYFYYFNKSEEFIYLFLSIILVIISGYIHYPSVLFFLIIFIDLIHRKRVALLKKYNYFIFKIGLILLLPLLYFMYNYSQIIAKSTDWPLVNRNWGVRDILKLPGSFISGSVPDLYFNYFLLIIFF